MIGRFRPVCVYDLIDLDLDVCMIGRLRPLLFSTQHKGCLYDW